jgi:hypothetical protein
VSTSARTAAAVPWWTSARFGSIEAARAHCQAFFPWYNTEHRHSGLGLHTAAGEPGPVFQGLELRLGKRVVVGYAGPRVRLGDAEVGEQERCAASWPG